MPMRGILDPESIRHALAMLRAAGAPAFTKDTYTTSIDPWWLETPERRGQLWEMMARCQELEQQE